MRKPVKTGIETWSSEGSPAGKEREFTAPGCYDRRSSCYRKPRYKFPDTMTKPTEPLEIEVFSDYV